MTTENTAIVQQAFAALIETGDVDAVGHVLRDDFVHHRPDATTSTKTQWLASVGTALAALTDMKVEMLHMLAAGDHVVVHSRRWLPDGPEITVVDICRLDDGLITEVWEIIEPAAHASANLSWWKPTPN